MQKLNLSQTLGQKLSPQQIQFIKLLQVPTAELDTRIEEELEVNPALEEGKEEPQDDLASQDEYEDAGTDNDLDIADYLQDDYAGYKMQGDRNNPDEDDKELPISVGSSLQESLVMQMGYLRLDERQTTVARQLIGSIDEDGYIRRDLEAIVNDLAFAQNIETDLEELESLLFKVQTFDPAGIGARDLKECLLLQLERKADQNETVTTAIGIIDSCFDEFTKKHYQKIMKKLDIESEDLLKEAINTITKLNPKPGGIGDSIVKTQYLIPDFILNNNDGKLELSLNSRNAPELKISRSYSEMLQTYDKSNKKDKKLKETVSFVKQKLDAAKWFIDAIKQRQQTLLSTMRAIIDF